MALILLKKLITMFMILFAGFFIVKLKLLRSEDSRILNKVLVYLVMPALWISAFQVEFSKENLDRFLLALANAALIHAVFILLAGALKKPLRLQPVEQASLVYTNCGNLIFPLVTAILGDEWIFYGMAYMVLMNVISWTHGKSVVAGKNSFRLRDFLNINIVCAVIGLLFFLLRIRLPPMLGSTLKNVGDMIGPFTMIYTGMLLAGIPFDTVKKYKRLWLAVLLRLVVFPLVMLVIFRVMMPYVRVPGAENIFVLSLLAAAAPSASIVAMMAQLYGGDAQYACVINLATTLLCILTLPAMVFLFQL